MLADYPVAAMLPAVDLERAKKFYEEKVCENWIHSIKRVAFFKFLRTNFIL